MTRFLARVRPLLGPTSLIFAGLAIGAIGLVASPDLRGLGGRGVGREFTSSLDAIEVGPVPAPAVPTGPSTIPARLVMPDDTDCNGCHTTKSGAIGKVEIPALAHPLVGWTNCTACHSNDRLVTTAPGHAGIDQSKCLVCHTASSGPAPPRPAHVAAGDNCLTCHGKTVDLPATMATRSPTVCWLCHHDPRTASVALPRTAP